MVGRGKVEIGARHTIGLQAVWVRGSKVNIGGMVKIGAIHSIGLGRLYKTAKELE